MSVKGESQIDVVIVMNSLQNISENRLARYRALVARLDICPNRRDEMIGLVGRMMQAFVDAAFGDDALQLSQKGQLKDSFQEAKEHANLPFIDIIDRLDEHTTELIDLETNNFAEGAKNIPTKNEDNAP